MRGIPLLKQRNYKKTPEQFAREFLLYKLVVFFAVTIIVEFEFEIFVASGAFD